MDNTTETQTRTWEQISTERRKRMQRDLRGIFWAIVGLIPTLVWFGYALSLLWRWFVPLPPISIWQAAGIVLVVKFLRARASDIENSKKISTADRVYYALLCPVAILIPAMILKYIGGL